jgi:hypothetical protein
MSLLDSENDGAHLANFSPLSPPNINSKKMFASNPPSEQNNQSTIPPPSRNVYASDDRSVHGLTNYQQVYETPQLFANKPYYAKMGISNGIDNKLMARLNYMVHLLEEQQHEKTANVTEEFLLYAFLGVFVIYVVDTFSRNGKYVR